MEKKFERILCMSEKVRDGGFNDLPLGGIDSDIVSLVRRFKPDKSAERAVNVVSLAGLFSDLTILDTT